MSSVNFTKTLVLLVFATVLGSTADASAQSPKHVDRHGDALPTGALARLGTIRFRHDQPVRDVHFSKDGKTLLGDTSTNFPGGGRMWDADTGKEIARFREAGLGYYATLSSDGRWVVDVDSNHFARLWDFATGKILRSWVGEMTPGKKDYLTVSSAYFSHDGKILILYGKQNDKEVIHRYDLKTGKSLRTHEIPNDTNANFVTSPDGKSLLGDHGQDNTISLLDLETGKKTRTLEKSTGLGLGYGYFVSPDSKMVVVPDPNEATIFVWDLATGKLVRKLGKGGPHSFRVRRNCISPNSKWLAVNDGDDRNVFLYELATGKLLRYANNGGQHRESLFSPDSKLLATCSDGAANICIWEVATGKKLHTLDFDLGHSQVGGSMAFAPDSKRFAFSSGRLIQIVDLATGKLLPHDAGHTEPPSAMFFSHDGKTLSTGGRDGGFRDWNPATGQEWKRFPDAQLWSALALPRGGNILVAIDCHWYVSIWDVRAGKELHAVDLTQSWQRHCAFSADCQRLATTSDDGHIHVFDIASGKRLHCFPWYTKPEPTTHWRDDTPVLAFSPDGRTLAALGQSRPKSAPLDKTNPHRWVLRIWELLTGKERQRISFDNTSGFGDWINDRGGVGASPLKLLADNKTFTITTASSLCLYRLVTRKELRRFSRQGLHGFAAVFSADGRLVAAPDDAGTIYVWETDTATLLTSFPCGSGHARLLAFSPDGKRLASAISDGSVLVWELEYFLRREVRDSKQLESAWHTLADANADKAFQAMVALMEQPDDALAVLKKLWRPAALPDAKRFARVVSELGSPLFAIRQKATRELEKLYELAEPGLKKALAMTNDLEARRRLEHLLGKVVERMPSSELLQSLRTIEVLERIGSAAAREVLQTYAKGMPGYRATDAAIAALARWEEK